MIQQQNQWILNLDLKAHPEGGYYQEVYRSDEIIPKNALHERFNGERSLSTSIYYLLEGNQFSAFHKIKSDEIWHFYDGSSVRLVLISNNGKLIELNLGINNNEDPQVIIPKNTWFAAYPLDKESYSLVGCTVSPGFDFNDFELGDRNSLLKTFPQHEELIIRLTKN